MGYEVSIQLNLRNLWVRYRIYSYNSTKICKYRIYPILFRRFERYGYIKTHAGRFDHEDRVSAEGKSLDSDVDPRFGGSAGFVLFDTETANSSYLYNSAQRNISQRAGIQTAQMIAKAGTKTLIIGQLGPKAAQVLNKSGIKIYAYRNGNVHEASRLGKKTH